MADTQDPDVKMPDPAELTKAMTGIAERSQRLVSDFLARQSQNPEVSVNDPLNLGEAFLEMTTRLMADPTKLVEAQMNLWQDYMQLWTNTARRMMGEETEPVVKPEPGDRRFKDETWQDNEVFDFIKQSYLLSSRFVQEVVEGTDGMDEHTRNKVDFFTKQYVDAMAPTNFAMTNPEVLRATVESGGENLVKGLEHLLEDLERGGGRLRITMTDESAFTVGENVAATPGQVVYQNDLIQLIQYTPTTETVHDTPLVIVPPWINKFYILDLRPKNSFIKWAVDQGHTVFVISWVNPDEKLARKSFQDYMLEGPLAAIEQAKIQTGANTVNMVGYCLGGTLLASTLAYLAARGEDKQVASATFLTTLTDFEKAGDLKVFIDDDQLKSLESKMDETGYLDGADMATTFNMLRANDLIWSFVINNYLLGKDPFPFDLLYWNSDSTRMPAAMHKFYLRNMYLENKLREPGGIELNGTPIDLSKIKTPIYMLSTREDHIAPWVATYELTNLVSGKAKFVLSASGHIAGVVNPPAANKYCYWTNSRKAKTPETWLKNAQQHDGSWWTDWDDWVKPYGGKDVEARDPTKGTLKAIEPAPGSYVKHRVV
jgi:polyhydroxyalkanoate synthase